MKRKWFIYLAMLFCLLMLPANVQAAAKVSMKVKVNNSYYGVLEKNNVWTLKLENVESLDSPFQAKILYLKIPAGRELKTGYYIFNSKGYLDTRKGFHTLNTKVGSQKFNGTYYFGEENGRLSMKGGWTVIKGRKYYLSSTGRRYENRWVGDYYLKEDGQIARNTVTPDGSYVDCDGRKCAKNQMRLSSLKKTLNSMISGYNGQWSVYVKDMKTGDVLSINNRVMRPASVIKLFVMASTYNCIQKGSIRKTATVNELLEDMITISDNECYNELVRYNSKAGSFLDGCKTVNQYLKTLGCSNTECHSTLHPSGSFYVSDGQSNFTSTKDAAIVLEKIYKKECVSAKYS